MRCIYQSSLRTREVTLRKAKLAFLHQESAWMETSSISTAPERFPFRRNCLNNSERATETRNNSVRAAME